MVTVHLSTSYFPNIQYFTKIINSDIVALEAQENYQRQSYRNRCHIYGANGLQVLSVPVEKMRENKNIRDVIIAYHTPWQDNHRKSIISAYKSSPFFEYYDYLFEPFFTRKEKFLWDLNMKIIEQLLKILSIKVTVTQTQIYEPNVQIDWRTAIHPKEKYCRTDEEFSPIPYHQVFAEKHGFLANLSILDLLFNEGPGTVQVLKKSTAPWKK